MCLLLKDIYGFHRNTLEAPVAGGLPVHDSRQIPHTLTSRFKKLKIHDKMFSYLKIAALITAGIFVDTFLLYLGIGNFSLN